MRKIIMKDAAHTSAENIIDSGLPLKRRHSRQELIERRQRGYQDVDEQLEIGPPATDTEEHGAPVMPSPVRPAEVPNIYMNTPLSLENSDLTTGRAVRRSSKPGTTRWEQEFEWADKELEQQEDSRFEEPIGGYPFLGTYHDNSIEAMVGYIAPFESVSQYDMTSETWATGYGEQRTTDDFWTQF